MGSPDTMNLRNAPTLISPRGHYSHTATHRGVVYVSGQLPITAEGEMLSGKPFPVQAQQALDNLDQCLQAAGTTREHLLSVTVYVTDMEDWPHFDTVYAQWIGEHRPARAVAGANNLHYGVAVEIQAVATTGD